MVKYLVVVVLLSNSCHRDIEQSYSHRELIADPTINHSKNLLPISTFSNN